jgi:hypothetical protein
MTERSVRPVFYSPSLDIVAGNEVIALLVQHLRKSLLSHLRRTTKEK